jgi:hypothetical protein
MIKWIERIEFIASEKLIGEGEAAPTKTKNTSICCRTSDSGPEALLQQWYTRPGGIAISSPKYQRFRFLGLPGRLLRDDTMQCGAN